MKFELVFERHYPHPVEKVWAALTDPAALGIWLMDTDFAPVPGRAFQLWCAGGGGGMDTYHCRVVAIEPPRRMEWSWAQAERGGEGPTRVVFELEPTAAGTLLTLRHSGDRDPDTIYRLKSGWPYKLDALAAAAVSVRADKT